MCVCVQPRGKKSLPMLMLTCYHSGRGAKTHLPRNLGGINDEELGLTCYGNWSDWVKTLLL